MPSSPRLSPAVARVEAPDVAFPEGKRAMANRKAFAICHEEDGPPAVLRWSGSDDFFPGPTRLRVTAAVDERVSHRLRVANAVSGEIYGTVEVLFACPGQVYGLELDAEQTRSAVRDGLALSLVDPATPLWIVGRGPNSPDAVLPHLAVASGESSVERLLDLSISAASVQPCDWMGVCVVDGLSDWALCGRQDASTELDQQWRRWFDPDTGQREDFRGRPCDGEPGGPETSGPFAVLARFHPDHPALALAEEGFRRHYSETVGAVGSQVVAETSYNIAYPMMALAVFSGREEYFAKAIRQLEVNQRFLADKETLWLRYSSETGERTFKNWSRGIAWYFLGLVRSLSLLAAADRPPQLLLEAERVAVWIGRRQNDDGLWSCFLDEPEVLPDTSGCAGIGAGLALGVLHNILDPSHLHSARRVSEALTKNFLDPDGWLRGASQGNKREAETIDLQRSSFRVVAPWGMGLFAQLAAGLYRIDDSTQHGVRRKSD